MKKKNLIEQFFSKLRKKKIAWLSKTINPDLTAIGKAAVVRSSVFNCVIFELPTIDWILNNECYDGNNILIYGYVSKAGTHSEADAKPICVKSIEETRICGAG